KRVVAIIEVGPQLDGTGRLVDLVVKGGEPAGSDPGFHGAVISVHSQPAPRPHLVKDDGKLIFGQRKDHTDGLNLSDDQQPVRVRSMNDVPRVHQSQPHAARYGRGDSAVNKVQLCAVNHALINLNGPLVLRYQRLLGCKLLLRNRILGQQSLVAGQIDSRIVERRLILDELPLCLRQHDLEGAGIDFNQQVTGVNDV